MERKGSGRWKACLMARSGQKRKGHRQRRTSLKNRKETHGNVEKEMPVNTKKIHSVLLTVFQRNGIVLSLRKQKCA